MSNEFPKFPCNYFLAKTTLECIPRTGLFVLSSERLNYTQARNFCQERNASLTHVISEERTEGLGKLISQNFPSFVGLSNRDNGKIWKNEFGICNFCRFYLFSK